MSLDPYRLKVASSDWPGLVKRLSNSVVAADFRHSKRHRDLSSDAKSAYNPALAIFIWHLNERALERISADTKTPADILRQLAEYPHPDIRALVAENSSTPMDVRIALTKDENPNVRYQLAESPSLPYEMLHALTEDDNPYVACRAQRTLDRISSSVCFRPEPAQIIELSAGSLFAVEAITANLP
jgi:hypothetical protein